MSTAPNLSRDGVPPDLSRALRSGRVWVIQSVGTLVWLALAYACLRIGRANGWRLTAATILGIFLVYLAAFLSRTALRVFRRSRLAGERAGKRGYKIPHRAAKEWLPDAAIVFLLFIALVGWNAVVLQSLPDAWMGYVEWIEAVLAWLFFFIFWLPLAAASLLGESGLWRPAMRAWHKPSYWLRTLAGVAVISFVLIFLLRQTEVVHWLEGAARLDGEALVTLVVVYAILLAAWLILLALVEAAIAAPERRSLEDTWD